jgi:hypothetical protein
MVNNIVISQEVIKLLQGGQKIDANIIIYRDSPTIECEPDNVEPSTFVISIKILYGEKPSKSYFEMYDDSYGIPVWVEKSLLTYLSDKPILISLKKGLFKRLRIQVGSEIIQSQ